MKKQLLLNLFKNHSWLEIGLESLWIAIILEYTQRPFIYPKVDPIGHLMRHIGDQYVPIIFTAVGTILVLFSIYLMMVMGEYTRRNVSYNFNYSLLNNKNKVYYCVRGDIPFLVASIKKLKSLIELFIN